MTATQIYATSDTPVVETELTYLSPGSFINRRFVAPAREVNTGQYQSYPVILHDGRGVRDRFTLESHGFVLADAPTRVTNFLDQNHVEEIYPQEACQWITALTGADLVVPMGWMLRTSGDLDAYDRPQTGHYEHSGGVQPPAGEVHVDGMPDGVDRMAQAIYEKAFPDQPPFKRFLYTSFWRTFSPPPQDCPLALCDGRSVRDDEGVPNTMIVVDDIPSPEEMLREIPGEEGMMAAAIFRHSPDHRWWYFSAMTRDEALLFVFQDSRRQSPWRVPHTAFADTSRKNAKPRESIEFRSVAYFY